MQCVVSDLVDRLKGLVKREKWRGLNIDPWRDKSKLMILLTIKAVCVLTSIYQKVIYKGRQSVADPLDVTDFHTTVQNGRKKSVHFTIDQIIFDLTVALLDIG